MVRPAAAFCRTAGAAWRKYFTPMKRRPSLHRARGYALGAVALCVLAASPAARADDAGANELRVSGFGTAGLLRADAPAGWGFLRTEDQAPNSGGTRADVDSRLGLQINYQPSPQFELVGQAVAERRASFVDDSSAITWAFAGWHPRSDLDVRVGRMNLDLFLLSDFRDVGFAYMSARPPVEFYGLIPNSLDGADVARTWQDGDARWKAKLFAGRSKVLGIDLSPGFGLSLTRESGKLLLRAGYTRVHTAGNEVFEQPIIDALAPAAALPVPAVAQQAATLRSFLESSGSVLDYVSVGLNYEPSDWIWTAEAMHVGGSPVYTYSAAYVSGGRRIGPVTLFGIASAARGDAADQTAPPWGAAVAPYLGPAVAQQLQALAVGATDYANATIAQRTLSTGARWDILPQVDIKLQYDHVQINEHGGAFWANSGTSSGHANVGSLLVDFVF